MKTLLILTLVVSLDEEGVLYVITDNADKTSGGILSEGMKITADRVSVLNQVRPGTIKIDLHKNQVIIHIKNA